MMIDMLNLEVYVKHHPIGDKFYRTYSNGMLDREVRAKHWIDGSYDAAACVRSTQLSADGTAGILTIRGNPSKWFQGHNVFGAEELQPLAIAYILSVLEAVGIQPSEGEFEAIANGHYRVKGVHINTCFTAGSRQRALDFVAHLNAYGISRHPSRTADSRGSFLAGQGSRRSKIKAYAKGAELENHSPAPSLPHRDWLIDFADDLVRFEVELMHQGLKRLQLAWGRQWKADTACMVFNRKMRGIKIPANVPVPNDVVMAMPRQIRGTYLMWLQGLPMRRCFSNRQTLKNHRDALKTYDIDITAPPRTDGQGIPLPIWDVMTLEEASIPEWIKDSVLFFEPQTHRWAPTATHGTDSDDRISMTEATRDYPADKFDDLLDSIHADFDRHRDWEQEMAAAHVLVLDFTAYQLAHGPLPEPPDYPDYFLDDVAA